VKRGKGAPNPALRISIDRAALSAKPHTGHANCSDGRSYRAGRNIWEPIALHVAIRAGMTERCNASGEATVFGGTNTSPSAVIGRYST
jgi:hypothetical protein